MAAGQDDPPKPHAVVGVATVECNAEEFDPYRGRIVRILE
jgi:hypothetical protein